MSAVSADVPTRSTARGRPGVGRAPHTGRLVRLNAWVPPDVRRAIIDQAERRNASDSLVIRELLEAGLQAQEQAQEQAQDAPARAPGPLEH